MNIKGWKVLGGAAGYSLQLAAEELDEDRFKLMTKGRE